MKKILLLLILPLTMLAQNYTSDKLTDNQFMQEFLLLGPFPNELPEGVTNYYHTDDCSGWDEDFLVEAGGEKGIVPTEGMTVQYDSKKFIWSKYTSDQFQVNLKNVFTPNDGVVAYAACWITSAKAQERVFGFGSNDGAKVYLNGVLIHSLHMPRPVVPDNEYLRLSLKKGRNLVLIKIDQGFGGWGFALRPVSEEDAWAMIQTNLDKKMTLEFSRAGADVVGYVGDRNTMAALTNLPEAKMIFESISSDHTLEIKARLGQKLKIPATDFVDREYKITTFIDLDGEDYQCSGYLDRDDKIVQEVKELIQTELPDMPSSARADYITDFFGTLRWLDEANKLWGHPYGYRRYKDGIDQGLAEARELVTTKDAYKGLFLQPKNIVKTKGRTKVTSKWKIAYEEDDYITSEIAHAWEKTFGMTANFSGKKHRSKTITIEISQSDAIPPHEDAYLLKIAKHKVSISARCQRGLYYGVTTFLELVEQQKKLTNAVIEDWPTFKYRPVLAGGESLSTDFKALIEKYAQARYNIVYIHSSNYNDLTDAKKQADIVKMFEFCRSRYMEPVPYIETFGAGTITRIIDPDLDEGIYYENEEWTITADGWIRLDVPRIHDCETTQLHIKTKTGRALKRDQDYELISAIPPVIKFTSKKYFGKKVLLSYDAVDFSRFSHPASCPSDPKAWVIMDRVIGNILTQLKPKYFHISQDEAGFINKDSRCLARGLTNQELMIDEITRVHEIIRKYSEDVEIHMWGDLFNDYQNAIMIDAVGAVAGIPRDILVLDWNYVGVYHWEKQKTFNQLNNYHRYGMKTLGVAWWDLMNIVDILLVGDKEPDLMLGVMHTAWSGFSGGYLPTAEANWTGNTIMGKVKF